MGITRTALAALLNQRGAQSGVNVACDERLVARWERGEVRRPSAAYRKLLASIGAPTPNLAANADPHPWPHADGSSSNSREAAEGPKPGAYRAGRTDDEGELRFLGAVAAASVGSLDALVPWLPDVAESSHVPSRVGMADVQAVRTMTGGLRAFDQRHGGYAVLDPAIGLLRWGSGFLAKCCDRASSAAMATALADLSRLIGWACYDVGQLARARRYSALALSYARSADADSLVASILYVLGRVSLFERRPREALRMFQLGQISAQDAANRGESARLYANEAWAQAMSGNSQLMHDALARADHEIDSIDRGRLDPWTTVFFSAGELPGIRAVIFNEYARSTDNGKDRDRYSCASVEEARLSLSVAEHDRPLRSVLFDRTTLATGLFWLNEPSPAVDSAATALQLAGVVGSARVRSRLVSMAEEAEPCARDSAVQEIRHQVSQLALPDVGVRSASAAHPR